MEIRTEACFLREAVEGGVRESRREESKRRALAVGVAMEGASEKEEKKGLNSERRRGASERIQEGEVLLLLFLFFFGI